MQNPASTKGEQKVRALALYLFKDYRYRNASWGSTTIMLRRFSMLRLCIIN